MQYLEKLNRLLVKSLTLIAGLFLVGMITITCANIIFRTAWLPIRGTFELMGYAGAIVTAFSLAYTQQKKGHIAVDVLVNGYRPRLKKLVDILNRLICLVFFSIAAWRIAAKAATLMRSGEVSETLQIIYYPFTCAVALGCLVLALTLLTEFIRAFSPQAGPGSPEGR